MPFRGMNPAAVLYFKEGFIQKNPKTVQAFTNAFFRTLKWLQTATPDQVAATVPEDYLGNKELYIKAFIASRESCSTDRNIDEVSMKSVLNLVATTFFARARGQ